jgi:hypothetical protein
MSVEQLVRIFPSIDKSVSITSALVSIQQHHIREREKIMSIHEARMHDFLDYGLGGGEKAEEMVKWIFPTQLWHLLNAVNLLQKLELGDLELALAASLQEQTMLAEKVQQQGRNIAALRQDYDTKRKNAEQLTQKVKQVSERTINAKANLAALRNEIHRMEKELVAPAPVSPEPVISAIAQPPFPTHATDCVRSGAPTLTNYPPSPVVRAPKPGLAPMHINSHKKR